MEMIDILKKNIKTTLILLCLSCVPIFASAKTAYVYSIFDFYDVLNDYSINKMVLYNNLRIPQDIEITDTRSLTVNGNGYDFDINSNSYGMSIDKKMNFNNMTIKNATGSKGLSLLVMNGGTLSLNNVEFVNNNIHSDAVALIFNIGTLNLSETFFRDLADGSSGYDIRNYKIVNMTKGDVQFENGIIGDGVVNIKGAKVLFAENANLQQSRVNISKGRLAIANSDNLKVEKLVNNVKQGIYLDDGTLSNTNISGKGSTVIQGNVILDSSATIAQTILLPTFVDKEETIEVPVVRDETGKILVYNGQIDSDGNVTGAIIADLSKYDKSKLLNSTYLANITVPTNSLVTNADSLKGTIINNANIKLTGGTITKSIKGTGNINIVGDVVNNAKIYQDIIIDPVLLENGADENGNLYDSTKFYSLTTNAKLLDKKISIINSGNLILTGGTLSACVSGSANIIIAENSKVYNNSLISTKVLINDNSQFITNASILQYDVENNGYLQLVGGILGTKSNGDNLEISGSGFTRILGKVTSNALISQKIDVSKKGKFTISGDNIGNVIYNQGTLNINGGVLNIATPSDSDFVIQNTKNLNILSNANIQSEINNWAKMAIFDSTISGDGSKSLIENYKILNIKSSKNGVSYIKNVDGTAILNASQGKKYVGNVSISGNAIFENNNSGESVLFNFNNGTKYRPSITLVGTLDMNNIASCQNRFVSNKSEFGGAILNYGANLTSKKYVFEENSATFGGVIYNKNGDITGSESLLMSSYTDNGSYFYKNTADYGGAIYNNQAVVKITGSTFEENSATKTGGVIYNEGNLNISNSRFVTNTAENGGAIYSGENSTTKIVGSTFENNSASNAGGAIAIKDDVLNTVISNSKFEGNSAKLGGAIYVGKQSILQIVDSSFVNNTASSQGGAIYVDENSMVNILAQKSNILFEGNKAKEVSNAIYLKNAKLNLQAGKKRQITINDTISGKGEITTSGNVYIANKTDIEEGSDITITQGSGRLKIMNEKSLQKASLSLSGTSETSISNGAVRTLSLRTLTLADNTTSDISIDMDLKGKTSDKITAEKVIGTGTLNVSKVNMTTNSKTPVDIKVGEGSVVKTVTANKAESAEATYKLRNFVDENGMLRTVAYGQKAKPCAVAAPVAAQLGGYLTQINSYDQAFMNMDMNMLQPYSERVGDNANNNAIQNRYSNRYASTDESYTGYSENNGINYNSKGLWTRPYATFERVNLSGGPKVSNIAYGNFFGGDADIKYMNNGWSRQFSAYIGYNGSTQDYVGQSIDQNGGNIGLTEVWYKNNFFTGLTVNVGANVAQASTDIGRENIPMLMAGLASKSGYNFEFKNGKFIIQPSLLLSYTFVHSFSHENGRGSHIGSSPLNAIQVVPGLKFIFNLPKGWQPYLGVNMRWNIIDKTHFSMQDVTIPDMSIDPYVEYGIGVQRKWGERFTGYGQAMIRNGGRNGVMLSFGFKWALGK